jgi:hypothetical protein
MENLDNSDLRNMKFACRSYKSPNWSNDATYSYEGVECPIVMPCGTLLRRDVSNSRDGLCKQTVGTRNVVARIAVGKVFASSISQFLIPPAW